MPSWPGQSSLQQHQPLGDSFTCAHRMPQAATPPLSIYSTAFKHFESLDTCPVALLPSQHSSCKYCQDELPESQNPPHVPGSSPACAPQGPSLTRSLRTLGLTNKKAFLYTVFVGLALAAHVSFTVSWWGGGRRHTEASSDLFLNLAFQVHLLNIASILHSLHQKGLSSFFLSTNFGFCIVFFFYLFRYKVDWLFEISLVFWGRLVSL